MATGRTAEVLQPLAFIQSLDNRSGVLACSRCGAFVGSARAQVAAVTRPRCMKDLEAAIAKGPLPILQEARAGILLPEDICGAEFCRNGCGEIFCSSACEISSFEVGHALTCVGQLATTDHPLYELKVAAIQSGHYEIVTLATKLVAMAVADGGIGPASDFFRSSAALAAQPPWDEGAADSDGDSDRTDEDESFTSLTWALCTSAFDVSRHAELAGDVGASLWPRLLGYVASRAVEVERPSPVVQYCQDAQSASLTTSVLQSLRAAILSWTEKLILESSGGEGSRPAKMSRQGPEDEERSFYRLLDESDSRLPRLRGLAILPRIDSFLKSCVPNCKAIIVKGSCGSVAFSLDCSSEGEPLTLCPFPTELFKSERTDMWQQRGDTNECNCARCVFEAGGAAADAVGLKELQQIAKLAQDDRRFTDALHAFDAILAIEPCNGDALFGRARVTSWDDRWSEAYRLMLAASALALAHAGIRSHLADEQVFTWAGDLPSATSYASSSFTRVAVGDADVYVSVEGDPLLSPDECAQAIVFADEYVAGTGGWKSQRHFSVPTTDVQVQAIPKLRTWFGRILRERIYPALGLQYGVCPANMRVIDAFVVKYDARAQRYLPVHQDHSQYSLTLPLNSNDDYAGGGTYFVESDQVINCSAGGMISFPGRLVHGGHPISRGTRYVIAAFLYEYTEDDLGQKIAASSVLEVQTAESVVPSLEVLVPTSQNVPARAGKKSKLK